MEKTAKKPLGRPKSERQRNRYLPVRVDTEELERVRAAAAAAGLRVSVWVRRRLGLPGTGYGE